MPDGLNRISKRLLNDAFAASAYFASHGWPIKRFRQPICFSMTEKMKNARCGVDLNLFLTFMTSSNRWGAMAMESVAFRAFRKQLQKTQKQMSQLLGVSLKAVHSYEQGWRSIPHAVERQVYFLISRLPVNRGKHKDCWIVNKCPAHLKQHCPAWEFKSGQLCWFINGTICNGETQPSWQRKMSVCRTCGVFIGMTAS